MNRVMIPSPVVKQRLKMTIESKGSGSTGTAIRVFWHLLRICLSFSLLFLHNILLVIASCLAYLRFAASRRRTRRNVRFYPKTVLITGVGAPHALALARAWAAEGHCVVGADVTDLDLPVRSGASMSKALQAFYRIPKDHYISRLLDVIHREKVDIWIPCSPKATPCEDATARQVIESRTSCKCITFDAELATCFSHSDTFRQYVTERGLPVLEYHKVLSRDSVHKILHRSPSKSYQMMRASASASEKAMHLPKRTASKTYTSISEIQISKDKPWILQQHSRLGELFADILVVRGQVQAINVRLSDAHSSPWGTSRLDEALAVAIHQLMQNFALKVGPRLTGHLSVRLMVDEEFDVHSVRHAVYIAGCIPGAKAVERLLQDTSSPTAGYLSVFPSDPVDVSSKTTPTLSSSRATSTSKFSTAGHVFALLLQFSFFRYAILMIALSKEEFGRLLFWKDPLFSFQDPLPWWWQFHVYQPLREIWVLVKQTREAGL
ncbi:uncharacterized protein N7511_000496 [Penicillium nucicola]|uniref:uncharacterized protein n=1 Tax=Penicillium nucicola TaxID=1850975 RepID=UPI002545644A|nr:uncharacterized protein N7511_000496 [Penicillium nucicola]KAJ5775485.1 hypothetical protein N7511_000496 [Penicillium nucicola]